jgi:hypothetical protein
LTFNLPIERSASFGNIRLFLCPSDGTPSPENRRKPFHESSLVLRMRTSQFTAERSAAHKRLFAAKKFSPLLAALSVHHSQNAGKNSVKKKMSYEFS